MTGAAAPTDTGREDAGDEPERALHRRLAGRVDPVATGVLVLAFVLSRVGAYAAGVRYDASLLAVSLQHLDLPLLQDRLAESLWYQHTQPPLFNLLIGLVLKLSPIAPERTFHLLWLGLGAVLVGVTYRLARELRIPRAVALVATVIITCSPTVLLYENWLAYEYPLTVGITLVALAAVRWVRTGRPVWLATAVGVATACVLTRALLNPLWLVGVVVIALVARPAGRHRRAAVAIVVVPAVLVVGLMVKNQVLFGSPSFSSWLGWNLQRVTIDELPTDERQRLIDEGVLSPLATYPVFLPTDTYTEVVGPCERRHPDVPVLAEPTKSTGRENFNDECYLPIYRESLDNALAAARAEPGATARAVVGSFQIWAESSSQYAFVYDNRQHLDGVDLPYRQLVLLDVPYDPPVNTNAGWWIPIGTPGGRWRFSITIVIATGVAVVAGVRALWRVLRRRGTGTDAGLAVIGFTVLTVTVVGNLFEIGENNRFRFLVEPITLVALTWFLARLGRAARRWWSARRSPTAPPDDPVPHPAPGAGVPG